MTIDVVVRLPDRSAREATVDADPEAGAGELAERIASWAGVDGRFTLFLPRTKTVVTPNRSLDSLGLVRGDEVELLERGAAPSPPGPTDSEGMELVAVGGPSIGSRWPLPEGEHLVGRGTDCKIRVEDVAMSRIHLRVYVEGGLVTVADADSTNGTFIDGVRLAGARTLQPGEVLEAGASLFSVQRETRPRQDRGPSDDGYIRFNRPPRVASPPREMPLELASPPTLSEPIRLPLASALIPLVIAVILWRLMPDNPSFLIILALSPLMMVISFVGERRHGKRRATREEGHWRKDLQALTTRLGEARALTADRERRLAPDLSELERRALSASSELWERRPSDEDFLLLRCGWGDRAWDPDLRRQPGGADELRREADVELEPLLILPSVPVTVSATTAGVIGLCGEQEATVGLLRWCLLQIATLHSPEEVMLVAATGPDLTPEMDWFTWLPHVNQDMNELEASEAVAAVAALIHQRRQQTSPRDGSSVVVVIDGRAGVPRSVTIPLLREGPSVGVHVLWLETERNDLPGECGAVVEARGNEVAITMTKDGSTLRGALEGAATDTCLRVARALAPLRDAAPRSSRGALPRRLSLFELLDPFQADASFARTRWSDAPSDLSAPLGMAADKVFLLDLSNDGPHVLVGGTTGAGKSELLQTLIASLALTYPPTRLTFLLIDYKGGAAFKDCVGLPHTVGVVTDLDVRLSERALISLNAEVRRREQLLRNANARDIAEMESGIGSAPPRLLLVIDEFATLVKELPAFVDGVVDIAQRGRSLGIHLVLATQRPAGVINDAVRANTNLRIALRVADEHDSEDVIGVRDAAHISRSTPGRAYVRRGHAEVEEIQTAFSGGPVAGSSHGIQVRDRLSPSTSRGHDEGVTQLETVVDLVRQAAVEEELPPPAPPWLPPLPDTLPFSDLLPAPELTSDSVAFGLIDRPDLQSREPALFDLATDAHLLVVGAGGSGKTSLLRSLASALASSLSPNDLHIYGLDFGSGGLKVLETLPHCGDVVGGEEQDRVGRLFAMIGSEVAARKALFAAHGVADITAWDSGTTATPRPPRVLVLLDGYAAFASAFERVDFGQMIDALPRYISDGRSVGIHFAITTNRRGAIPSAVAALVPTRVVLRLAESDDYLALGLDARALKGAELPPGRGFTAGRELQVAVPGPSAGPADESDALRAIADRWASTPMHKPPGRIALLPGSVHSSSLPVASKPWSAVIGIAESKHDPVAVDLEHGHFVVAGPYRSGRSTALETLALSLRESTPDASLHLVAPRRTPLTGLGIWDRTVTGEGSAIEYAEALAGEVQALGASRLLVFVDDADELAEGAAAYALEPVAKRGRDTTVRFIAAAESRAMQRAFGGWLSEVRKDKQGLLLDPDLDVDGDLLGVRLPRSAKRAFPPGRGYLVTRGPVELIQVAHRPQKDGVTSRPG